MRHRILIVEDDSALERVLRDNLEYDGYEVATVTDGRAAIQRAKDFNPDLVLLDVSLPGKDGFELCRLLRASRQVSIIFLTVRGQKDDKLRGLSLGADDYVTKPFDLEELLARIRAVLRRSKVHLGRVTLGSITIDFETLPAGPGNFGPPPPHTVTEKGVTFSGGIILTNESASIDSKGSERRPSRASANQVSISLSAV